MPRFRVAEIRARKVIYLIDAVDERAARHLEGDILDEGGDADDYGQEILEVEEVADDEEFAE